MGAGTAFLHEGIRSAVFVALLAAAALAAGGAGEGCALVAGRASGFAGAVIGATGLTRGGRAVRTVAVVARLTAAA